MPILEQNFNETQLDLILHPDSANYEFNAEAGDYIQLSIYNDVNTFIGSYRSSLNELPIYYNISNDAYVKPNEILDANDFNQGIYNLKLDYWKNPLLSDAISIPNNPRFIIQEISPSRKEVRLLIRNDDNSVVMNTTLQNNLQNTIGTVEDDAYLEYKFDYILSFSNGRSLAIVNYTFDTNGDGLTTMIVKLSEPLFSDIQTLSSTHINQEVLITQLYKIYYVGSSGGILSGDGLEVDFNSHEGEYDGVDVLESYDDLYSSASMTENDSLNIIDAINNNDINLNVDYSEFTNHVVFGSAQSKLENFRDKAKNIENYYTELSASLYLNGVHITNRRETVFNKINEITQKFTPYEKYLYYDNQLTTTGSAPGIGINYAKSAPVTSDDSDLYIIDNPTVYTKLKRYEGFNVVHKHTNENTTSTFIKIISNKYNVDKMPFTNYSGSIYLSFLIKGDETIASNGAYSSTGLGVQNVNSVYGNSMYSGYGNIPADAKYQNTILAPSITGSAYRRFIYQVSQSHWRPTGSAVVNDIGYVSNISDWSAGSSQYEVLHGANITGSYSIANTGVYPTFPVVENSLAPFVGSIVPGGSAFDIIYYSDVLATTSSYVTDVKVTLQNPLNALPFAQLYSTASTNWNSWYNGQLSQSITYDTNNIHSLSNNLPEYMDTTTDYATIGKFLNMLGEHFDLLRTYIDTYTTFHNREYSTYKSPPKNLTTMIGNSIGWDFINIYSGSLAEYYSTFNDGAPLKDIEDEVHRNVLNNLIHIYKSKGTLNSIRSLLNLYNYPPDLLNVTEYGGNVDPSVLPVDELPITRGVSHLTSSVSFVQKEDTLYSLLLDGTRKLNIDWRTNSSDAEGIEFVFKHVETSYTSSLLINSGSGNERMWDLRISPSGSANISGSMVFRLNTSKTGSLSIDSNNITMETPYLSLKNNKYWNVLLQRTTSSVDETTYKLYVADQDGDAIPSFVNAVSASTSYMNVLDDTTNENFISSGSLSTAVSGNLVVMEDSTGSIAEIRTWDTALSASTFRQHVLDKKSIVGNGISGSLDDLIYRYRLNENYASGSTGMTIIDSSNTGKNYTQPLPLVADRALYIQDTIIRIIFSLISDGYSINSNKIIINPQNVLINDLNHLQGSYNTIYGSVLNNRVVNRKLSITTSPTSAIDSYILNNISNISITELIGEPSNVYSVTYDKLEKFRSNILQGVSVDINKFISKQGNVFNNDIVNSIEKLIPAKSMLDTVGVVIQQDLLSRNKYEHKRMTRKTGADAGNYAGSYDVIDQLYGMTTTAIQTLLGDAESYSIPDMITITNSSANTDHIGNSDMTTVYSVVGTNNEKDYIATYNAIGFMTGSASEYKVGYPSNISYTSSVSIVSQNDNKTYISPDIDYTSVYTLPTNAIFPIRSGTDTEVRDVNLTSKVSWEDSDGNDYNIVTELYAGANGEYSSGYVERTFIFNMIGDLEIISSSLNGVGNPNMEFTERRYLLNSLNNANGVEIGRTAYFSTSSVGDIVYPANHYIVAGTSKTMLGKLTYDGTQNLVSGTLVQDPLHQDSLPNSPAYTKTVGGSDSDAILKVIRKK